MRVSYVSKLAKYGAYLGTCQCSFPYPRLAKKWRPVGIPCLATIFRTFSAFFHNVCHLNVLDPYCAGLIASDHGVSFSINISDIGPS
ncbi:hypothetical protein B0O95_1304 [Mycetohabitans endofungorum]|uniref:Uncharacterized protein n=1 Tax=Mycetohabitans endofungorum TaxID=417203 RepID=A0A2P5K6K2_9BURK|nr:hypothetical protein B0O95_1304 [Mycetohabitans endofungorum]